MLVLHNEKSRKLAERVAKEIGAEVAEKETKVFPDGEVYVRVISPIRGDDVVVISTTQTNEDLIELILTLSALRDKAAKKIICVVPHLIYQRQDSAFKEGEAISAKVVLGMLNTYADKIITVNAHFLETSGDSEFGGVKVTNLDAFPLLGKHFNGLDNLVIFSPDEGSMHYAEAAAKAVGCEYDHLIKKRIDGGTVEMQPKKLNVSGKNVIILDDIISTGGTMMKAAETLKENGAKGVYLGCVHGLFTKGAELFGKTEVVCTDSLPGKLSKVSLAPIIVKALK